MSDNNVVSQFAQPDWDYFIQFLPYLLCIIITVVITAVVTVCIMKPSASFREFKKTIVNCWPFLVLFVPLIIKSLIYPQASWDIPITCGIIGWLVTARVRDMIGRYNQDLEKMLIHKMDDNLKKHTEPILNSLDRLSPYFAFRTEHGKLEALLRQAECLHTKAKWVVPLFISRKITSNFEHSTKVEIETDPYGYSEIIKELLPFATSTIYMTCPMPPTQWFKALLEKDGLLSKAQDDTLTDIEFPGHVREFMNAKVANKYRFVILPKDTLNDFFNPDNRGFLNCFLRFSNSEYGIKTKFTYMDWLCNDCTNKHSCDVAGKDFQIWDESAMVELVNKVDGINPPISVTCRLVLHPDVKYTRLFSSCFGRPHRSLEYQELKNHMTEIEDGKTVTIWGHQVGPKGLD